MNKKNKNEIAVSLALLRALKGDTAEIKKYIYRDDEPIIFKRIDENSLSVSGIYAGNYTNQQFDKLIERITKRSGNPKLFEIQVSTITKVADKLVTNLNGYPATNTPYTPNEN